MSVVQQTRPRADAGDSYDGRPADAHTRTTDIHVRRSPVEQLALANTRCAWSMLK